MGVSHSLQKESFWSFVKRTLYLFEIFLARLIQRFAKAGFSFAYFCACARSISMRSFAIWGFEKSEGSDAFLADAFFMLMASFLGEGFYAFAFWKKK